MLPSGSRVPQLVSYTASDSSSGSDDSDSYRRDEPCTVKKRARLDNANELLQVPTEVLAMFQRKEKDTFPGDNLTKHSGRIRSFPHFEGDWASFVYIPIIASQELQSNLKAMVDQLAKKLPDIFSVCNNQLHISVSQTVSLRHYWIEPMLKKLRKTIALEKRFFCYLDLVEAYTNDEKTRTFVGIRVLVGEDKIKKLTSKVDAVFKEYGLEEYYKEPRFHLSFAWHLFDVTDTLDEIPLSDLQDVLNGLSSDGCSDWRKLSVRKLCFRTGNKTFQLPLG